MSLLVRATVAFLALPGVVAFLVPLLIAEPHSFAHEAGIVPVGIGVAVLFWCVHEFYVAGRGAWPRYAGAVPRWCVLFK